MRLILEGPDNSGKTTLATSILQASRGDVMYYHPGGKPADFEHECRCIDEQVDQFRKYRNIVMDRITPISQQVYNPDPLLDEVRNGQLKRYWDTGAVLIYCRPSTDRLLRVQDLTWREGESEEHKQKIIANQHLFVERYDNLMRTIPCICYDFEDSQMANVILTKVDKAMRGSVEDEEWFRTLLAYR